jgi:hypothetical protein
LNETEWLLLSVQDVFGTNITFQVTQHFRNGTERIRYGWIDIDTGNSSEETIETANMEFMAISADLNVDDVIYTSPRFSDYKIDENVNITFPDGERETNHLYYEWSTICLHSWHIDYYWDKSTGILVEHSFVEYVMDSLTTSVSYRLTDSNVWTVPEFPTWTSILLILTVLTVAIAITKQRLHKTPIH